MAAVQNSKRAAQKGAKSASKPSNRLEDNMLGVNTQNAEMLQLESDSRGEERARMREKSARNIFKKFYHLNMNRTMKILGYSPSALDERKFLHSHQRQQIDGRLREALGGEGDPVVLAGSQKFGFGAAPPGGQQQRNLGPAARGRPPVYAKTDLRGSRGIQGASQSSGVNQ